MRLRPVESSDLANTRRVVADAFAREDIAAFLDRLRGDACLLGEWLAEDGNQPVAHIAFSRVAIESSSGRTARAAQLAPLCVAPDRQRQGIGTQLTQYALNELESRGEDLFLVLGHPDFYRRFGFRTVAADEIAGPWTGKPSFMVRGRQVPRGRLVLPAVIANAP